MGWEEGDMDDHGCSEGLNETPQAWRVNWDQVASGSSKAEKTAGAGCQQAPYTKGKGFCLPFCAVFPRRQVLEGTLVGSASLPHSKKPVQLDLQPETAAWLSPVKVSQSPVDLPLQQ